MSNVFGKHAFGQMPFGDAGTALPGASVSVSQDLYSLELWSGAQCLARITDWTSGQYTKRVNEPSTLEFTYPYTGAWTADIRYPRYVVLRNRQGQIVDRLYVAVAKKTRDVDGSSILAVTCEDMLGQLGREIVEDYSSTTPVTIPNYVKALLGFQASTYIPRISFGSVESFGGATRLPEVKNKTILQSLMDLHEGIGGFIWVDTGGYLRWRAEMTSAWGQQIRLGKNMPRLDVENDYRSIRTKVIGYGKGSDEARITTTKTYATGTYGVITHVQSWPEVSEQDELDRLATALVRKLAKPEKKISCGTIDLSMVDSGLDWSHEKIELGARVRVIDDVLDEVLDTRIVEVRRDLVYPHMVEIEVADPSNTIQDAPADGITDVIAGLLEQSNAMLVGDVQMGAVGEIDDAEIQPIGAVSDAGTSSEFARADHVHEGAQLSDIPLAGSGILSVGGANVDGTSSNYARVDHVHEGPGAVVNATDKASLPSSGDGTLGYTTGSTKRGYLRINGAWLCITHLEA